MYSSWNKSMKRTGTSTQHTEALLPVALRLVYPFLKHKSSNIRAWNTATVLAHSSLWAIMSSFRNWKLIKAKATVENGENLKGQMSATSKGIVSWSLSKREWNDGQNRNTNKNWPRICVLPCKCHQMTTVFYRPFFFLSAVSAPFQHSSLRNTSIFGAA